MPVYQWEFLVRRKRERRSFPILKFDTGPRVISRNIDGTAKKISFQVYTGKPKEDIFLVGEFNNWSNSLQSKRYQLTPVKKGNGYFELAIESGEISHADSYAFVVDGTLRPDPATTYFDKSGRSVFWDFDDPSTYKPRMPSIDRINRSVRILQTDLVGLIYHFKGESGKYGNEVPAEQYCKFVAESGVIDEIKRLGFNTVQFLPLSQFIDGDKWSFRYLVPFIRAVQSRWGTPDDYRKMIDVFHKKDIAVIFDFVISHVPYKQFNLFGLSDKLIGIHHWKSQNQSVYLGDKTHWGTIRYDFNNPNIQNFIIQSALHYLREYHIDGFRIDNVDGIIRTGKHGQGEEKKEGRTFLRELNKKIYSYDPHAYIHYEAHYFFGNNAKWLVAPIKSHKNALGATAYNSSRLTYFLHKEYMPKSADGISPWNIKYITDEKEWGKSNSTVADFHNHDAAAGLMENRATGSYAYDALILDDPKLHEHAIGKLKVMESLIAFTTEGRFLDLLQTHLLQTGTFEHDLSIHWHLRENDATRRMLAYKAAVNKLASKPAFWPANAGKRVVTNVDETSKSLSFIRADSLSTYVVFINMSAFSQENFVIPVTTKGRYQVVLNSDDTKFGGTNVQLQKSTIAEETSQFELFRYGITINTVAPYGVIVWKIAS